MKNKFSVARNNASVEEQVADTVALIVAYRRHSNLKRLIDICLRNNIQRIYIFLDGPSSLDAQVDTQLCFDIAKRSQIENSNVVRIRVSPTNLGTAVSVLTACNWIFKTEKFALILEDDCLPSEDFFEYIEDAKPIVLAPNNIYAISGSQFAPSWITKNKWSLSSSILIWGWATSQVKWQSMYQEVVSLKVNKLERGKMKRTPYVYWKSGTRRALLGYIDAWDIPLMFVFKHHGFRSIVPNANLIINVGTDEVAVNTTSQSKLTHYPLRQYTSATSLPEENHLLDRWNDRHVYGISLRHHISTRISLVRDSICRVKSNRGPLQERLLNVQD